MLMFLLTPWPKTSRTVLTLLSVNLLKPHSFSRQSFLHFWSGCVYDMSDRFFAVEDPEKAVRAPVDSCYFPKQTPSAMVMYKNYANHSGSCVAFFCCWVACSTNSAAYEAVD